jgi:hypothetical protein
MRNAFAAVVLDKAFIAEAEKQKLDLSTAPWQDVQASIEDAYKATREQIEIARKYYQ